MALAGFGLALAGCASIWEGTTQEIAVSTDPPGAECGLYRRGDRIAAVARTPGSAVVRKSKYDIWIVCVKPGYQEAVYFDRSGVALGPVVAGILTLGISNAVDSSTGSDNRYDSPANVVMLPGVGGDGLTVLPRTFTAAEPVGAYSQQVASPRRAVSTPGDPSAAPPPPTVAFTPPPPAAVPTEPPPPPERSPPPPPATSGPSPFDGIYSGSVDVLDTTVTPAVMRRRQIDVRVANGVGSGTVTLGLCAEPGEVSLTVDSSGVIRGRANTRNTVGCTERITLLDGRMEGQQMRLGLRLPGYPQLVMAKTDAVAAAPPPAAPAPPRGQFDGTYSGPLELEAGDMRQVWMRVVGTKGTGSIRRVSCAQPGLLSIDIAADGSISGDADVLSGPSCTPRKANVRGQMSGTRMSLGFVFADGQASREVAFSRRSF